MDDRLVRELIEAAYNSGYYSGKGEDGQPHHTAAIKERERLRAATLKRLADLRAALEKVITQFDGIADDKWPTEGMKVAIQQARAALAGAGEAGDG